MICGYERERAGDLIERFRDPTLSRPLFVSVGLPFFPYILHRLIKSWLRLVGGKSERNDV